MTKAEIAAHLGMANVMFSQVEEDDETNMIMKVREALLLAQLILTQEAIDELNRENKER